MQLYIAGLYTSHFGVSGNLFRKIPPNAQYLRQNVRHYLESYHYIHKGKYVDEMRRDGVKCFLDSGAFSAFTQGVTIDIAAYAEFVKNNKDIIIMASVLDEIGDHLGTWRNQQKLESLGAEVLPCFHYGEPLEVCEYYCANYEYMTIGGMVPIPNNKLEPWLDEIWDKVLTDGDGMARTKVHGFGLTTRKLMEKYPWYSVDSSSWIQIAAHGNIVLPELPGAVAISARSPTTKQFGRHFNTLAGESAGRIEELLTKYGLTVEECMHTHGPRWALNAFTYDMWGRMLGDDHWQKPFRSATQTLF